MDGEEEEEELEDLPEAEKNLDPLKSAHIRREVDGKTFYGRVEDIEVGKLSKERLYRIKYTDGDLEHLTDVQVRDMQVDGDEYEEEEEGEVVSKRPAAGKAAPKAAGKAKAKGKAKAAPKAKGKAKAKAKGKAKAKAAPKAKVVKTAMKAKAAPTKKPARK